MKDWKRATEALSADELMAYTKRLAEGIRISGSADEARVFDYIEGFMEGLAYRVTRQAAQALIGYPNSAAVEVPSSNLRVEAIGYSLSPSTGDSGVAGRLVYVGRGLPDDYKSCDLRGKIALSEGMGSAAKAVLVDRSGALAHINIDDEWGHELCISPVWGSPAPEDLEKLPKTPSVGVRRADGAKLRALAEAGAEARLRSDIVREWRNIPILTADLPGMDEDNFVLFSGHVDSWYYGAMDNATANAVQLGVARVLAASPKALRRGIRFAFWSGHSHGRYAGSTWYADEHWQELHERCVCHVNIDSAGAIGADLRSEAQTMAETHGFSAEILRELAQTELGYVRMSRAGDQSFWGAGVPSMFMLISEHRADEPGTVPPISAAGPKRQGANPWFWHTKDDTLDKIDPENLLTDARVYCAAIWRLCTEEVLPFEYAATAREIVTALKSYEAQLKDVFDLSGLVTQAVKLEGAIGAWSAGSVDATARNRVLMALGRALIPVAYTRRGPFHQDPATGTVPLPGLAAGLDVTESVPASEAARSMRIRLARERNRIGAALSEAMQVLQHG